MDIVGSGTREHDGRAYRVVYGKPKGGGLSVEQSYRYPVEVWSESEARAHCTAHDGMMFEPATAPKSGSGMELGFWAAVQSVETGDERRLATFYIMDTGMNRNGWRATDRALGEALTTLLGKPLGCIPGHRVNHVREPLLVGNWVKVEKPDGCVIATAEITDPVAWEKLRGGEWGPVSVVIRAFRVTCSRCGANVTGATDEHIERGEGHEVVESFAFDRVDFVAEPAYPQAGVITMGRPAEAGQPNSRGGAHYPSRSYRDGAQGPQGNLKPEGKEGKSMEELEQVRQELEQVKAENAQLRAEKEGLRASVRALEEERRQRLVDAALEARLKAGLADSRNRQSEARRLEELDDGALALLTEDAWRVTERMARAWATGPKARHTQDDMSAFEAAVEDARERIFGRRRGASGGVV